MRISTRLVLSAAVVATISACAQQQPGMGMMHSGMMQGGGTHPGMMNGMMGSMHQMQGMQLTGNPDKDFVQMMRMHHARGVEMARFELQKGSDPQAKEMAQKIVDSQSKEIEQFDQWLQHHR